LSVRIAAGKPNSWKVRSNTVKASFSCVVEASRDFGPWQLAFVTSDG
jgi:hypothetical protein